jgi:hypothetical protein
MFRVIDTIRLDEQTLQSQPEIMARLGRGLLVILDPAQVTSAPVQPGTTVRVHRPDGGSFDRVVSGVDVPHSVVGLFFRDTAQHEIPRLSEIELLVD